MLTKTLSKYVATLVTILVILLCWQIVIFLHLINPLFLPSVKATGFSLVKIISTHDIYFDVFQTLCRALLGLFISILVAVPIGLFLGRHPAIYNFFELPIDFFRSVPSSSLFPLFIILFGIGNLSKIGIVFYGCSLILIINTIYGARPTKDKIDRINILKTFGASKYQILKYAIFRDALPQISSGIKVCISLAFVLVIVSEMYLGSADGLGKRIYDYYLQYNIPEMYASILILGFLGFFINKIFGVIERRFIFWLPK